MTNSIIVLGLKYYQTCKLYKTKPIKGKVLSRFFFKVSTVMKKLLGFSKLRNFIKNAREKQQQNNNKMKKLDSAIVVIFSCE